MILMAVCSDLASPSPHWPPAGIGLCQCRGNLILRNVAECELGWLRQKEEILIYEYLIPSELSPGPRTQNDGDCEMSERQALPALSLTMCPVSSHNVVTSP